MKVMLKPCPFCGDKGELFSPHDSYFHHVECFNCGARCAGHPLKELAITAWNTRDKDLTK